MITSNQILALIKSSSDSKPSVRLNNYISTRERLNNYIDINKPDKNTVKALVNALMSGEFPEYSTIHFEGIIKPFCMNYLLEALQSGKFPKGLKFSFYRVNEEVAKFLARVLMSGKCPKNFRIEIFRTNNWWYMEYLADALISGKCPEGLGLTFKRFSLGSAPIKPLVDALYSGMCPEDLSISVEWCYEPSVVDLLAPVSSGQCPDGLELYLSGNELRSFPGLENILLYRSNKCPKRVVYPSFCKFI